MALLLLKAFDDGWVPNSRLLNVKSKSNLHNLCCDLPKIVPVPALILILLYHSARIKTPVLSNTKGSSYALFRRFYYYYYFLFLHMYRVQASLLVSTLQHFGR